MVRLLYFASVREAVGIGDEEVELPPEVITVDDLIGWLATRGPEFAAAVADRRRLRVAVDTVVAGGEADVRAAAEIALFPPVTGG